MSSQTFPVETLCGNCGATLPLESLACPQCHALRYSVRLDQLARDARALEAKGKYAQAQELWACSLPLLPHDSTQAAWVRERLAALEQAQTGVAGNATVDATDASTSNPASRVNGQAKGQAQGPKWIARLGPLGPIALMLFKAKGLLLAVFKLKFLFSFLSFIAIYVALFGWRYGLGISVCILIHELGHYIDIRRRGLPAEMPVFLPGLGAYVRWNALGVTRSQIAGIALAGPLAGWIAAACCYLMYTRTGDPVWAALARTGAILNVLNLIPVWVLDGGQAVAALGMVERAALLAVTLTLWLYSGETIFVFVAIGAAWRLFTKDKPQQSDWGVWIYYAAVLAALTAVLHVTPETMAR